MWCSFVDLELVNAAWDRFEVSSELQRGGNICRTLQGLTYKFLVFSFIMVYHISFLSYQLITDSTKRGFGANHRGGFTLKF